MSKSAGRLKAAILAVALVLPGIVVADQTDEARFDLTIKGLRAGSLSFAGSQTGSAYTVSGKLESGGLIGALRKIRYDAQATGAVSGATFTPARYSEKADNGKRESESVMDYVGGVPQVKVYNPPRKPRATDVDPASQGGTVDPLTALYAVLRDVPADQACTAKHTLFDGRHRSQISLSAPEPTETGVTCAGEYRRLAGFSEKDMAEKVRFPFRLTYEPAAEGMLRVVNVSMDTLYGKGELKRR